MTTKLIEATRYLLSVIETDEQPSEADLWPVRDALSKATSPHGTESGARFEKIWLRIMTDRDLDATRQKLSIHTLRLLIKHSIVEFMENAAMSEIEWLRAMAAAARDTWTESCHIHDTRRWPQKYGAPYGGLAKIGELLAQEPIS